LAPQPLRCNSTMAFTSSGVVSVKTTAHEDR
jgi:hypothetical protein